MNVEENLKTDSSSKDTKAWLFIGALAGGHSLFHWVVQGFVVVLPEVQSHFALTGIEIGLVLTVRELSTGLVAFPGGVVADSLRRHSGAFLAACIGGFGIGSLLMGASPMFGILLAGVSIIAILHSLWHLSAASSLSQSFPNNRGGCFIVPRDRRKCWRWDWAVCHRHFAIVYHLAGDINLLRSNSNYFLYIVPISGIQNMAFKGTKQ